MKITNWLKAGRRSKKETEVIVNANSSPDGSLGEAHWKAYVQLSFYSKEKSAFQRLTMTPEEASKLKSKLEAELNKLIKRG